MATNPQSIVAYYEALLIAQYANKPKAVGTIGALMGGADGLHGLVAGAIYNQVRDGFDLLTAVGKQLDFLGELIGPTRFLSTLDLSKNFIGVTTYGAPDMGTVFGIADYDMAQPPSWYLMTYEDFISGKLQDGDYRRVLQFLAAVQRSDYAYETLDIILFQFFGGNVNLKVTNNMEITYQHLTSDTDNLFTIIRQMNLLPAPSGVNILTQEVLNF